MTRRLDQLRAHAVEELVRLGAPREAFTLSGAPGAFRLYRVEVAVAPREGDGPPLLILTADSAAQYTSYRAALRRIRIHSGDAWRSWHPRLSRFQYRDSREHAAAWQTLPDEDFIGGSLEELVHEAITALHVQDPWSAPPSPSRERWEQAAALVERLGDPRFSTRAWVETEVGPYDLRLLRETGDHTQEARGKPWPRKGT